MTSKDILKTLLEGTGVSINGNKDYDIQIYNEAFYDCVLKDKTLGLGEAYMDSWWDCKNLDEFFYKIISANVEGKLKKNWKILLTLLGRSILYMGRKSKAFEIAEKHYDIGNDLYRIMLDKRLTYTCAYWSGVSNLDEAQENKLDLVCRKIGLKVGEKVLDIGSGWSSFTSFAAEKYGVKALGITVSKEQKEFSDQHYQHLDIETRLQDYRDINGKFDKVVSLGMFEHVGRGNYRKFMKAVHNSLRDGGLFLLQTIGGNHSVASTNPWIEKYIFPNSMLPSIKQIGKSIENLFVLEDLHNFGSDYDLTLMAWWNNFSNNWDQIKNSYSTRFYRMWKYYILSCAGAFRARDIQLWQIVLSKNGVPGGYSSLR